MSANRSRPIHNKKEVFLLKSHNKARKALAVSLALALLVCLFPTAALAAGETIRIGSTAELIQAIQNQEDGQTWVLAEGTYDVGDACTGIQANLNGVQQGFVLPLYADNLTIRGEGDVTLTSTFDPNTGAWSYQNFITVGGVGVTLENLKLQGNHNSYFDGCNKVLELVGGGKDLTLKNVQCLPLAGDGGQNSGSIYINVADAGSTKLEDVTLYSWINARAVTTGTVLARNVVQDFTDNVYAGYYDTLGDGGSFRLLKKLTKVTRLRQPSRLLVITDSDGSLFYDFMLDPTWTDMTMPGTPHTGFGNASYADGHVKAYRYNELMPYNSEEHKYLWSGDGTLDANII